MTQGRLYKSARATGAMAEQATLALPERAGRASAANERHGTGEPQGTAQPAADAQASTPADAATQSDETPASSAHSGAFVSEVPDSSVLANRVPTSADSAPTPGTSRPDVTDYDHIFAEPAIDIVDSDDDLFPWDSAPTSAAASPPSPGSPAAATPPHHVAAPSRAAGNADAPRSAAAPPTLLTSDAPKGVVEGTNNPVNTYLARAPRIRLTFSGAVTAISVVTIGLGFVEALLSDHIGLVTSILSVATALAATWFMSERDRMVPALVLPVAWLICALLPGQLTAPPTGSLALKQVVIVLGVLGDNAVFIIAGCLACYILARTRTRIMDATSI